jgi:DNA helicase II / ATP-dependent DNA helicase PcrA
LSFDYNPDQQGCIDALYGDYVVIAGPGSGKTAVLLARHLNLLSKGIPTKDILNLTFTRSAAKQMKERVGLTALLDENKVFRTFHSFALDLVMREKDHLPFKIQDFVLPSYGQDFQLLKDLIKMYPAITSFRSLKEKLAEWKASNVSPEEALEETYSAKKNEFWYACAYRDYEKKCREQGWLDFDSLMKEAVKLMETNDEVRARNQFKFISVDECQDTDVVQFRLLKSLYAGNIFVVGDENQLIYEWRSAVAGNLSNFTGTFPKAKSLYLGQNYRSTQRLVEFFKKILPVDNGIASHMVSMREEGVDPVITRYDDDIQESTQTLLKITDYNNSVIIARTNRQLRTVQKMCMARGIKSMILGQKDLWQTNEVKHLLDLVKKNKGDSRSANDVLTHLMNEHNLNHIYRNTGGPNEKPPVENLNDIIKLSAGRGTTSEFLEWLRKLTYACEAAKDPGYEHRDKYPMLALATVHQAKGREWKYVFVIGAKQGLMPHKDGEFWEEKRIFFVAYTRAADTLNISYYQTKTEFLEGL